MTGITTLKARHYKPLIGFLTETIDRSFEKENKLAAAVAARQVCDHGKLAALRQRREVAYRVLENVLELSLQVFFWLYLIGITGLFLIMMNRLSFKKYHLFTYLCIAELVPFLILAKWIMVLGQ